MNTKYIFLSFFFFVFLIFGTVFRPNVAQSEDVETKQLVRELLEEVRALKSRVVELESQKVDTTTRTDDSAQTAGSEKELNTLTSLEYKNSATNETSPVNASTAADSTTQAHHLFSNTTIGGYASIEAEDFKGSKSTFDQHRFVLNVGSRVADRLKFYSELEYEHGTTIEGEGQGEGELTIEDTNGNGVIDAEEAQGVTVDVETENGKGGEIAVEQAWMQFDATENLGIRAGIILMPFGIFNLNHDDHMQNLTDRPIVSRRVIPTTWSEAGAGIVGNFEVKKKGSISAELYAVNGLNDEFSAGSGGLRDARGSYESDNNSNKALVSRVAYSPSLEYKFGLSGYRGAYDSEGNNIHAGAVDWDMRFGPLRLLGEGALFGLDDGVNADGDRAPKQIAGMYAEANYDFWFSGLNQTFLGSGFDDPKFISIFRYNVAEINRRGGSRNLDEESFAVGLAYRPVNSFVFKNEFQWNTGDLERGDSDGFISSVAIGF